MNRSGVRERGKSESEDLQLFCCVNSKSAPEGSGDCTELWERGELPEKVEDWGVIGVFSKKGGTCSLVLRDKDIAFIAEQGDL